jgi:hypothetical protein
MEKGAKNDGKLVIFYGKPWKILVNHGKPMEKPGKS